MKHRFTEIIKEELNKENDCKNLVCTEEFKDMAEDILSYYCTEYYPEFNDLELVALSINNDKISAIGTNWINDEIYFEINKKGLEIKTKSNTLYLKVTSEDGLFTLRYCDFILNYMYNGDIISIKGIHKESVTISVYTDIDEDDNLSIIEKHNNNSDLIPDYEIKYDCHVNEGKGIADYTSNNELSPNNFHGKIDGYWCFCYQRKLGMKYCDNCHENRGVLDFRVYKK